MIETNEANERLNKKFAGKNPLDFLSTDAKKNIKLLEIEKKYLIDPRLYHVFILSVDPDFKFASIMNSIGKSIDFKPKKHYFELYQIKQTYFNNNDNNDINKDAKNKGQQIRLREITDLNNNVRYYFTIKRKASNDKDFNLYLKNNGTKIQLELEKEISKIQYEEMLKNNKDHYHIYKTRQKINIPEYPDLYNIDFDSYVWNGYLVMTAEAELDSKSKQNEYREIQALIENNIISRDYIEPVQYLCKTAVHELDNKFLGLNKPIENLKKERTDLIQSAIPVEQCFNLKLFN